VGAVIEGKICSIDYANEICRTLCLLSLSKDHAETVIVKEHALLAMHVLLRNELCSQPGAEMIAMFLRNLSCVRAVCKHILEQEGLTMLRDLMRLYNSRVLTAAAMLLFHNLSKDADLHVRLCEEGIMAMIKNIAGINGEDSTGDGPDSDEELTVDGSTTAHWEKNEQPSTPKEEEKKSSEDEINATVEAAIQNEMMDPSERRIKIPQDSCYDMVMTIQLISLTPDCRLGIVQDGSVVKVFFSILSGLNDVIRHEMVCSLCNLASSRECREDLVQQGAIELLVILSDSPYPDTQAQCATALGYLSENTVVNNGTCASLLLLSLKAEEMKESLAMAGNVQRKSSTFDLNERNASITSHKSALAPAKELLALQNVKSLTVMIRDGLLRRQDSHGVMTSDVENSTMDSESVETFRGTSLEDLNAVGYAELTPFETEVLNRDYSKYEYGITTHPVSQEGGGVSEKKGVELPYPSVAFSGEEVKRTAVGELFEMKISGDALPKNEDELKVLEAGKTTSTVNESTAEGDDKPGKMRAGAKGGKAGRQEKYMNRQMSFADETIRPPGLQFYNVSNTNTM